jgi:cytochrome c-type biogenesis protein CcmH
MRSTFYVLRFTNLLLLAVLLCSGVAYAQEPSETVSDDDVNRVSRQLYCPICENIPLDACTTQACDDWRELIREKLAAGESDKEIVAYFADVYGERVRATPTTSDLSLAVWILPLLGVVVGGGYLVLLLRRWLAHGAAPQGAPTLPSPDDVDAEDDYRARLERDIQEHG